MLKNGFLLCCVLLCLLLLSPLAALGEAAEEVPFLELTPGGRLNFYNGTYHYVIELQRKSGFKSKEVERIKGLPQVDYLGAYSSIEG